MKLREIGLVAVLASLIIGTAYATGTVVNAPIDSAGPQVQFSDLGGSAACSQLPALTGAITSSAGACATSAGSVVTASKTTNYNVLSTDNGAYLDNTGASGAVNFTLPTAAAGFRVCVTVTAAQTVELVAPVSTTISMGTTTSATAGNLTAAAPYSLVCVYVPTGSTTKYIVDRVVGTWTVN